MEDRSESTGKGVKLNTKEGVRVVNMMVKPEADKGHQFTLIVFGEEPEKVIVSDRHTDTPDTLSIGVNEHILLLEAELGETRTNLQMAIEGLETSNEEMQSSNEELLSANEELQSSNEELQSLNEELHTLNTEHQLKIKELVELNDDMDNYFRSTDIGQVFVDANLRIRKFNPAAVNMINLIPTDIGRPINHISTNIQQDNLIDDINAVINNKHTIEKELVLSNGNMHLIKIMPYIRQDKQTDGVVITFVDITAIKELDMLLKGVFNASTSMIMAFKAVPGDFSLLTANKAAERLLGRKAMTQKYVSMQSLPQLMQNGLFDKYMQVVEKGGVLQTEFKTVLNGTDAWFELAAVKTQDGIVITCNDLTEKKDTEDRLRQANQELESSNTELQQYAFVASHDLKEPLRKIHMFGNMLKERYNDNMEEKAMDYLNRIINSSSRMTSLINDLLKFSRLSQVNYFEQVNLNVIIKEILSDLEILIQEKNAIVTVSRLPVIEAVPGQLRQVFQNLLSNAFKFSRKDIQPMINISATRIKYKRFDSPADLNGPYLCITISDNGIGFDEKYLDKIFVLFQRLHTKDKFEGTGIGLAVTRKIVDKHNGLITAHSREKEGATFTIILPVKQEHEAG
jgi:two-component system CheB/CheR fusion protein